MQNVILANTGTITMTSLELVEFINSQRNDGEPELLHKSFLAKVPQVLGEETSAKFIADLPDSYGRARKGYSFPKREACLMAMSYSYELQAKVFDRMTELEAQQPSNVVAMPDFSNPAIAARAWADQYEARLIAEKTKAEIGSRREATAMNTASQAVKLVTKLEIELDKSKQYATVKRVEMLFHGQKFDWRLLRSVGNQMCIPAIDVFDANYGTVKAYHTDVWREAFAIEINQLREAA